MKRAKELLLGRRRLDKSQRRLWHTLEFLARLILLSIPLYLIIWLGVSMMPLQVAAGSQSAWVLEAIGFDVKQEGNMISVSENDERPFRFGINEDCTAWKSMLFLFALVFAVPGIMLSRRLLGLVIGFPVLWAGNIARIVGVVLAENAYGIETALLIHDYGWQLGLVALVLGIWILWLRWARPKKGFFEKVKSLWREQ